MAEILHHVKKICTTIILCYTESSQTKLEFKLKTTWRKQLTLQMLECGESFDDIESSTLSEQQLDDTFDNGYGGSEGCAFTVWTKNRVYFPAVYDGSEWVACVPRNPNGVATSHVGGE